MNVYPDPYYYRDLPVNMFTQWRQMPSQIETILFTALHNDNPMVRFQAAKNLQWILYWVQSLSPNPKVIPVLIQGMKDDDWRVRANARTAGLYGNKPFTTKFKAALFEALKDDTAEV